jgi:hypothetical protein
MSFLDKLFGKSKAIPDDQVRAALRQQGDPGTKPRMVDHLAYFKTMDSTQAFMQWVIDNGYTISPNNHEFGVEFCKESPIVGQAFENDLAVIKGKVKSLKGDYDGWGCPVTK